MDGDWSKKKQIFAYFTTIQVQILSQGYGHEVFSSLDVVHKTSIDLLLV
jgi:hypothetical protein